MLAVHPVHRRLAEIQLKAEKLGSYARLSASEQIEALHCLRVNADIVRKLDELKQMAYIAQVAGDMEWVQEICRQIDAMEAKMT